MFVSNRFLFLQRSAKCVHDDIKALTSYEIL